MCGIIGIASTDNVSSNIINSLKKLEYRGYDSAGIAINNNEKINQKKVKGKLDNLIYALIHRPNSEKLYLLVSV